ncbi:helix-turn-helix domain-containing protein [Dactylosporangium cerinum]|uniref:Helix-turn-helix domain-containing protein n=1 Tax=Dactylosporangium cerinum TaxID=1434730 RepID=A0ABV9VS45_9ACTN
MDVAGRVLSPAVFKALTYWPGWIGVPERPEPVDSSALARFLDDLLHELPWWNAAWQVTEVEAVRPREFASNLPTQPNRFTEVSVPGKLCDAAGRTLPFFALVRFEGGRLLRFQAKIGDTVLGPALGRPGRAEPHPFGAVLHRLMVNRGISATDLATKMGYSIATVTSLRAGARSPHPVLVRNIARALDIPEADLAAIAGVDTAPNAAAGT